MMGEIIEGFVRVIVLIVAVKRSQKKQYEEAKQGELKKSPMAMRSQFGILTDSPTIELTNAI